MAVTGAIAAVAALGATVYQGERQASAQRSSLRAQGKAQRESATAAAAEQRRAEMEQRKANRKSPNVASLLAEERTQGWTGQGTTMLTGSQGIARAGSSMKLGQTSMLGQ